MINQSLNTCIILVGGRSDLFNSGGGGQKGGRDIFKIQGGVGLKGELKNSGGGGFGPWMRLCLYLMSIVCNPYFLHYSPLNFEKSPKHDVGSVDCTRGILSRHRGYFSTFGECLNGF